VTVTRTADYAASILPRLLRFELLDLPICPVDLSLLCRHPLLQILFVLLPRLHLIADQGAAEQAIAAPMPAPAPALPVAIYLL